MLKKMIWGVLVVLLVAVSFAYAAANTVPVTGAGDGEGTISGYKVTGVHYVLNKADPGTIESVTFSLTPIEVGAPDPTTVKVKLIADGGTWYTCNISLTTWSCPISGPVTVLAADELRVVAAQ